LSSGVITFNYDVALDISLGARRLPYTYALKPDEPGLPLLKLHGSLNWSKTLEIRGEMPTLRSFDLNSLVAPHSDPWDTKYPDFVRPDIAYAAWGALAEGGGWDPEPLIVPPTWTKGEYQQLVRRVWKRAAEELEKAAYIVIIGYSLPPTDQFFKWLFSIGTAGRTLLRKVILIDKKPAEGRFREFLGAAALRRFSVIEREFGEGLGIAEAEI
jgi:hypothetical protein